MRDILILVALLRIAGLVLKHGRLPALLLLVVMVTNGALTPLGVLLSRNMIDSAIDAVGTGSGILAVLPWVMGFVVVMVLYNLRELLEQILKIRITHRLRDNLLPLIADKTANLQYWCFEDSHTHDLISRIGTSPESQLTQSFWEILFIPSYVVTLGGLAALFLHTSWWVLPSVFVLSIPAVVLGLKHSTESYFLAKGQTMESRKAGYLSSLITGRHVIKEIRLFGLNSYLSGRWRALSRKLVDEKLSLSVKQQKRGIYVDIASVFLIFGSIAAFAISVRDGKMTYGQFVALSGAMTEIVMMMTWYIPYQISQMKQQAIYWAEFQEFLNLPEISREAQVKVKSEIGSGIEFRDVHFTYPGTENEILKGVSFCLRKGDKLAIVGRNGAGKSTIIKLLLGLYEPDSGSITVDGVDLSTIDMESRRRLFSAVFQDFFCYSLTARENIGFGNVEKLSDDDAILAAADRGMAGAIVRDLPNGLDTYLGRVYEEGTDLSVGQWQRLAISRAQMADSEVIILDEPASALDPISEAELYRNFAETAADKTCILVSHRLGSARMATRILVIDDGKVVEEGSHEDLMRREGVYHSMFMAQAEWYREEATA